MKASVAWGFALLFFSINTAFLCAEDENLPGTIDVGQTGFAIKRPVFASACPHACPWGELGDFIKEAMEPFGYEVILCRNCNRDRGPRIVSTNGKPPALDAIDAYTGTTTRVNAGVDFGVTASGMLTTAYRGTAGYARGGPYKNLRLIAKIEDPTYLLVAVRKESGITDLSQIKEKKSGVKILGGGGATEVLKYYGLDRKSIEALGGSFGRAMGATANTAFDIIIDHMGSSAMNPESSQWTALSEAHELLFLQLPEELLTRLEEESEVTVHRVTVKWGFLRGIDHPIKTIARSGETIFCRNDTPEQAAYDIARAIDEQRGNLKWYVRPYSYDPSTVWKNDDVPLHSGAARYYREVGYMISGGK